MIRKTRSYQNAFCLLGVSCYLLGCCPSVWGETSDAPLSGEPHPSELSRRVEEPSSIRPVETPEAVPAVAVPAASVPLSPAPNGAPCQAGGVCTRGCSRGCGGRLAQYWRTHCKPCLQASHWGYPEYFYERPFGSRNAEVGLAMIAAGLRDQMVLYDYDFAPGEDAGVLKRRGLLQLEKLTQRMVATGHPIVIEASGDAELDALRRENVLAALAAGQFETDPTMVVVGRPGVRALDGVEALPTYQNVLEQTRLRGNVGIETSALRDIGFGSNTSGSAAPGGTPGLGR